MCHNGDGMVQPVARIGEQCDVLGHDSFRAVHHNIGDRLQCQAAFSLLIINTLGLASQGECLARRSKAVHVCLRNFTQHTICHIVVEHGWRAGVHDELLGGTHIVGTEAILNVVLANL